MPPYRSHHNVIVEVNDFVIASVPTSICCQPPSLFSLELPLLFCLPLLFDIKAHAYWYIKPSTLVLVVFDFHCVLYGYVVDKANNCFLLV